MEFERSDPPSALKSRRPQTIDVERRSSAPSRATSPPPPSQERRHTIENSAALARWTIAHGDTRGPRPLTSPRRASGRFDHDDASDTSSADSEECQAPRRSWAQAMELTGDLRRPELSPVVEESSPDSDRSTPQPTIPLEDHLGDLLALPPAHQRARPSETVQLEADLGAMLEAVRPAPPPQEDVTMEDAALDTTQLLASLGLDDASLSKDAPQDVAADDETGQRLAAALAAAELTGDDDDGALVAATLAARSEAQALREAAAKIREAADECRRRSANILRTSANDVELAARVAPEVASSVVEAAKTFGRTVVLAASADADQRITRAFDLARVDVEQREKECLDAITALSEQEKAGDNIDAQTERLRQDAEHTIQQRRRSNQSEETWDATIAAKLAAGLEPWTPRSGSNILDFPHALYGTWLSVEVADDRLIGRRERLDDDKDLMLKALRKARGTDACATALFEAPATWLHPRASQVDSGFEVMGSDVEVLSLFASKLARFAKELFRLEHRCDVRGVAFGETDCVVDCRVASSVRPAGLRVEFRVARGYPAAGFERAGLIGADGLLAVRLAASRGDDMLVGAAERALSARGLCGERTDGWFAAKSTPGSLLRTLACVQGACDAPDGSAILQPAQ